MLPQARPCDLLVYAQALVAIGYLVGPLPASLQKPARDGLGSHLLYEGCEIKGPPGGGSLPGRGWLPGSYGHNRFYVLRPVAIHINYGGIRSQGAATPWQGLSIMGLDHRFFVRPR